jgi:hypothetical protein
MTPHYIYTQFGKHIKFNLFARSTLNTTLSPNHYIYHYKILGRPPSGVSENSLDSIITEPLYSPQRFRKFLRYKIMTKSEAAPYGVAVVKSPNINALVIENKSPDDENWRCSTAVDASNP